MSHSSVAPTVEVKLDKPRKLLYDLLALEKIEEQLPGESTFSLKFWEQLSAKKIRIVLWAGLLNEDPSLTLEQATSLLVGKDPAPILKQVLVAWGLSRPEAKEEDPENPTVPEPMNQPGSSSGQQLSTTSV